MDMMFARRRRFIDRVPKLLLASLLMTALIYYFKAPPTRTQPATKPISSIPQKPQTRTIKHTIQQGDNLSKLFKKNHVPQQSLLMLLKHPLASPLKQLKLGRELQITLSLQGELIALRYAYSDQASLLVKAKGEAFDIQDISKTPPTYELIKVEGKIEHSLYKDAESLGVPLKIIMEFSEAIGWKMSEKSLRKGDTFTIIYEKNGTKVGHLAAGSMTHRQDNLQVFCPEIDQERSCYDAEGVSVESRFLRIPLKHYSRISDPFNPQRKHPVLKTVRPHWGTDFAAKHNTPIHVTANGTITSIGRKGGFGNFIEVNHGQGYTTRYAHMSKFAKHLKKGSHVTQDQVIGYVGSTGLSTGNHLHYEIRKNNQAYNPMTVTLPGKPKLKNREALDLLIEKTSKL